ncbi:heavy-metal-associated domain-containing protein [Facklamia miroungae]|uniref:Copper chaperone CopZ n=1 Tax=Facklamia miroungae TaxID=120956 RepID=A0A1G7PDT7_9LACT|nr:heavy-metal-associated domain-containing protein [Facklamia miroungae]NKZ28674.1 heavy-metal-associated domain-containing protein [Facklamia miroungae]SDF84368.1 Copper chaperone CopZ [Facklamia miroungae]
MKQAIMNLETLACPSCLTKIETAVKTSDGVDEDSVKVYFNASKVKLAFDDSKTSIDKIKEKIEAMGYTVDKVKIK